MKLSQHLTTLSLCLLMACGGGNQATEEKKDSTTTEQKEETPEVKEEPKTELSEDAKMLVKKWQMTGMTHVDKSKEAGIDNAFLDLKADGTFAEIFKGQTIASGKWMLSEDKKTLTLVHETGDMKGREEKMEVKEMSATKLVTADDDGKMTETYEPAKE